MKFGDYLRQQREEKNWTQPEAALRAEIEQSYLSKLETGKSWPSEEVFSRLVAVYGVEMDAMLDAVASSELAKLKEIGEVRAAIFNRQRLLRATARGWMIATLACLFVGGACLGLTQMAEDTERVEYEHSSMGVLRPDEPLDAFNIISYDLGPQDPRYDDIRAIQKEMIPRLDVETRVTSEKPATWYVENVSDGRRYFRLSDFRTITTPSPLRWFIVPAFAFLIGSLGCAFITFRWK